MAVETIGRRPTEEELVRIYGALGEPTRLRIVRLLAEHAGGLNCREIVERLDLTCSTLSHHLALLHGAGLVERRKAGKFRIYRLRRAMLAAHAPGAA